MKNTVDNLSKSKVILMCGPAGSGKCELPVIFPPKEKRTK